MGGFGGTDVPYNGMATGCTIINYGVFYKNSQGDLLGSEAAIANAIVDACTKEKVHIINLSLGSDAPSSLINAKVQLAVNTYGVLVVCAAGNDGVGHVTYPAALNESLSVGAVGYNWTTGSISEALFSDQNNQVDVVGVGKDVFVAQKGGGFSVESGTSFAAPIIAGYAALKLQEFNMASNGKMLAVEQLRAAILADAVDLKVAGRDDETGYGFITQFDEPPMQHVVNLN